jgi:aspartate aminotransferase-like enzyme
MEQVHTWVEVNGFDFFAEAGYRSRTVTAVRNVRGMDVGALNAYLRQQGMLISDGYGPLKGDTFRIAHMGDVTDDDISDLLGAIGKFLEVG